MKKTEALKYWSVSPRTGYSLLGERLFPHFVKFIGLLLYVEGATTSISSQKKLLAVHVEVVAVVVEVVAGVVNVQSNVLYMYKINQ